MVRPVRRLWPVRTVVRRRHRTWMFSMSMASLGWGFWWTTFVLRRFAPTAAPDVRVTEWLAGTCAVVGFLAALWCFRAKLAWLLFMAIALFANGSLLLMPWIVEVVRTERSATREASRAAESSSPAAGEVRAAGEAPGAPTAR